MPGNTAGYG